MYDLKRDHTNFLVHKVWCLINSRIWASKSNGLHVKMLHIFMNNHRGIDEKKQDPEKQKNNPDEHKQECNEEMHASFKQKHDPWELKQEWNKEMQGSYNQKHDLDEQKRIIEDCKKDLANDPSNKEAYIKMG